MHKVKKLFKILQVPKFLEILLRFRVAAGVEHSQILALLSSQIIRTIVDIGANRGQFSLAARYCFPYAQIIAFEPQKEPAELFRCIFNHDLNITLHECAIGPCPKEMTFHISQADDSSSLLSIAPLQNQLFPGTAEKEKRIVQVNPLDAILNIGDIKSPALLKMDVQGFELHALEGCRSLLPSFLYIYVECSFMELYIGQSLAHDLIDFLKEFSFIFCGVYNLVYDKKGIAIQGDFLFKKQDYLENGKL
jgi:FkbM family methyltransferase